MQRTLRKDYSERLVFLRDHFLEIISSLAEALNYSLDISLIQSFNFKNFHKSIVFYEEETEKQIFSLIALQSPNAKDLRLLLGLYKSSTDLIRISKTIIRISKVTKKFCVEKDIDLILLSSFEEMGSKLTLMFKQILDILGSDSLNAEQVKNSWIIVLQQDDYIDSFFKDIKKILIKKIEEEIDSKRQAKLIAEILLVIRHMERIGDHLCDLVERVLYIETGKQMFI